MMLDGSAVAKRTLDIIIAVTLLILLCPILVLIALAIYLYDFHCPLYVAPRVGLEGQHFRMVKFRTMTVNADRTGVTSTSSSDVRITPIGRYIRSFKLDELVQLWSVLWGDMSVVGPRPNVPSGVAMYSIDEQRLLAVRPGITDYASIVFADEGDILKQHADADIAYNQLIRPWKGHLGIFYIEHRSIELDLKLILLTALAILSRKAALKRVVSDLVARGAPAELAEIASRQRALEPAPPPGFASVITERF